jgi:hypothetical protein
MYFCSESGYKESYAFHILQDAFTGRVDRCMWEGVGEEGVCTKRTMSSSAQTTASLISRIRSQTTTTSAVLSSTEFLAFFQNKLLRTRQLVAAKLQQFDAKILPIAQYATCSPLTAFAWVTVDGVTKLLHPHPSTSVAL